MSCVLRKTLDGADACVYRLATGLRLRLSVTTAEFADGLSTRSVAVEGRMPGESVDVSRQVPEPWASAMERARLVDPRNGRPSMSALAQEVGTHTSTISAMMAGTRKTNTSLVAKVAVALRMEDRVDEVFAWIGRQRTEAEPFTPHPDADLLTSEERQAVNELIRLMTRDRHGAVPANMTRRLREAKSMMSAASAGVGDAVAAHEEEGSIAGEQEESDTP